ncbi:hypothetical protein Tco_0703016 [Tanacetum coccineum]|uniref:Integrase, catalytic region, zinc finger, CCHC-type, peptidase aspartic, catalytic n=1 Tax=Tanacetum coccineum TaxID=301880 RepID=A0ABQ4XYN1_9ASTR
MLIESIRNGTYQLFPKITVKAADGVSDIKRKQTVVDLAQQEKLRYDSDIKAVNILLLGLPVDIYTLINHYQTAKEIWDQIKELIEGTKMTKKERESMLYDEFNKFISEPRESIHSYYLRYAKLINDMKMIPISMSNMQINTEFVKYLQPEWSRFIALAKQARDLHSVNFDQLYAFLKHNERDAKEVREMRQRFLDPLALLANTYNLPMSYSSQQIQYHTQPFKDYQPYQHYQSNTPITQQLIQSPPLQSYAPLAVQQPPTFQPDTRFAVPTFLPTDDPIATTIQNGQVTVQNVQGRQSQSYAGSARNNQYLGARVVNTVGNAGANQTRDFLADSLEEINDCEDLQLQATANFKADYIDAYDSDCDDEATANAIFMANLSPVSPINGDTVEPCYDSNILSEVPHYDTYHESDMLNTNVQELEYIENIVSNNESYDELMSNSNVISYADYMVTIINDEDTYVPPLVQNNDRILFVIEHTKTQVEKCNMVNQETQSANKSLTSELEQYKERVKILENKSKDSASNREKFLDCELRTTICDRNRKVSDYGNQVFSQ